MPAVATPAMASTFGYDSLILKTKSSIIASLIFTLFWVPKGNTGGTNISPIKQIPIRKELKKYFLK
jgi:hypothetical protein